MERYFSYTDRNMIRDTDFAKTKIIGTIGPASEDPQVIARMLDAGMDVVRLNCSHSAPEDLGRMIDAVREASRLQDTPVAILADLGGPKIRLARLEADVPVKTGEAITLSADQEYRGSDKLPAGYEGLAEDLRIGNRILIDDGLVELKVESITGKDIGCRVMNDGVLKSRKGINLPEADISISCITDKDRQDIEYLATRPEVDFIALSFVRHASDIRELRELLTSKGRKIPIIAKVEKPEAVEELEEIVQETDLVMVARGDLGVEMPAHEVPMIQKRIIAECNRQNKPVITATQMLDSMITNPRPTRAEASDVANAVLDGTDAVMLSGETSVGRYPVETVRFMDSIVRSAEQQKGYEVQSFRHRLDTDMGLDESICHSACAMAEENGATAIITLTQGGRTARLLSRFRPTVPVIAFTEDDAVVRYLNIIWGVQGEIIERVWETDETLAEAAHLSVERGYIREGDIVVLTAGIPLIESPHTNMIKIQKV